MSRIGRQQETLAQVVDRLEGAVAQLVQLAETLDLNAGVSRPYAPVGVEAARAQGANLAMALAGDELRAALADRFGHDPGLLLASLEGAGLEPLTAAPPTLALRESAERLRALRSELRAS